MDVPPQDLVPAISCAEPTTVHGAEGLGGHWAADAPLLPLAAIPECTQQRRSSKLEAGSGGS